MTPCGSFCPFKDPKVERTRLADVPGVDPTGFSPSITQTGHHARGGVVPVSHQRYKMQTLHARSIQDAQVIVTQLAFGAQLSPREQSVAREWQYANLTVGDQILRVGVSTGGVISFDGDPFTLSKRVLCTCYAIARKSLSERLARTVLKHATEANAAY